MAAISITAANCVRIEGPVVSYVAAEAITAGQVVRLSTGTLVVATNASLAGANALGIALNSSAIGQRCEVALPGSRITIGGTVAIGKPYVLGTAGGIIPVDDYATGEYNYFVGFGETAAILSTNLYSGVAAAAAVS